MGTGHRAKPHRGLDRSEARGARRSRPLDRQLRGGALGARTQSTHREGAGRPGPRRVDQDQEPYGAGEPRRDRPRRAGERPGDPDEREAHAGEPARHLVSGAYVRARTPRLQDVVRDAWALRSAWRIHGAGDRRLPGRSRLPPALPGGGLPGDEGRGAERPAPQNLRDAARHARGRREAGLRADEEGLSRRAQVARARRAERAGADAPPATDHLRLGCTEGQGGEDRSPRRDPRRSPEARRGLVAVHRGSRPHPRPRSSREAPRGQARWQRHRGKARRRARRLRRGQDRRARREPRRRGDGRPAPARLGPGVLRAELLPRAARAVRGPFAPHGARVPGDDHRSRGEEDG